jgi:uncharacterized protein
MLPPDRESLLKLLHTYIKDRRVLEHVRDTELVMRALARRLGRDEELWGVAGLIHDLDIELQEFDFTRHGELTKVILTEEGLDPDLVETVVMHNDIWHGKERATEFQWALASADRITWLISATARSTPDRSLAAVTPEMVLRGYHDPSFGKNIDRKTITECERLGISLEEFVSICLEAMQAGLPF